jgi:hypothetical protein
LFQQEKERENAFLLISIFIYSFGANVPHLHHSDGRNVCLGLLERENKNLNFFFISIFGQTSINLKIISQHAQKTPSSRNFSLDTNTLYFYFRNFLFLFVDLCITWGSFINHVQVMCCTSSQNTY